MTYPWSDFLLNLAVSAATVALVMSVLMTLFLLHVTGKALLERRMLESKGQPYADYVASTSGFFPLPPRRRVRRVVIS